MWSNTVGFPRTSNLFMDGATDGERFKRFARHSMVATPFWYSAYPTLTTDNIRSNAAIRNGLATDHDRTRRPSPGWPSSARLGVPPRKLESNEIQSLLFGGLGFLPHGGQVLLVDLAADQDSRSRGWLKATLEDVAFDDGRRLGREAVVTLALGPGALAGAGLAGRRPGLLPGRLRRRHDRAGPGAHSRRRATHR